MRFGLLSLVFLTASIFCAAAVLAPVVTLQQSAYTAWWNDTIVINGSARHDNGTGIYSASLNITVGNVRCNNTTDATGNYTCRFAAPKEVGKYVVLINVTNSTGPSSTNTSTLDVLIRYGDTPIGTADRVVHEIPAFIQEMSGRIRTLIVRIIVWRA